MLSVVEYKKRKFFAIGRYKEYISCSVYTYEKFERNWWTSHYVREPWGFNAVHTLLLSPAWLTVSDICTVDEDAVEKYF
jgi:hypothetical protein